MQTWKQKLTSRKFWAAMLMVGLCGAVLLFGEELGMEAVAAMKCAAAAAVAYIFGESAVDIARK